MPAYSFISRPHDDTGDDAVLTRPPSAISHSKMVPTVMSLRDVPSMPALPTNMAAAYELMAKAPLRKARSNSSGPSSAEETLSEASGPLFDRASSAQTDVSRLASPQLDNDGDAIDELTAKFFSVDHLDIILRDTRTSPLFRNYLHAYLPEEVPLATEYINIQKAITAVEFAYTIAESVTLTQLDRPPLVATLDERLEARSYELAQELCDVVLPQFLTNRLTQIASDSLTKEITGQSIPVLRELLPSLAEVYCVCDPSLPDNPIVYASQGFYHACEYSKDHVLGGNCRFLQGPQTSEASLKRLSDAMAAGVETTETILNYRRNGTPYLNLITVAPLFDKKGSIRYWLGAQIDVSSLIQDGRGFESFNRLLCSHRVDSVLGHHVTKSSSELLSELGAMLSHSELNAINSSPPLQNRLSVLSTCSSLTGRRVLGATPPPTPVSIRSTPTPRSPPSVFTHYLLVRPAPCLTIVFTSPALRIPGLAQSPLLDRVSGPSHVRDGLLEAFQSEVPVTAKVQWTPTPGGQARERWLHCTPLMGMDEVGVWMVLMLDPEEKPGVPVGIEIRDEKREVEREWGDYLRRRSREERR